MVSPYSENTGTKSPNPSHSISGPCTILTWNFYEVLLPYYLEIISNHSINKYWQRMETGANIWYLGILGILTRLGLNVTWVNPSLKSFSEVPANGNGCNYTEVKLNFPNQDIQWNLTQSNQHSR